MGQFNRPLNNIDVTRHFVKNILEISDEEEKIKVTRDILKVERQLSELGDKGTLNFQELRESYSDEGSRNILRKKILEELLKNKRINDDEIVLGSGGALPKNELKKEKQAFIIIGSPASGKSKLVNEISDKLGAVVLDTDYAKRKFPEFSTPDIGADLVHGEASLVTNKLMAECCFNGYNIIVPKIGNEKEIILRLAEKLKKLGYSIHLTLICLDRKEVTKRAYERFKTTKRYTPLSLIFDTFSNDTIVSYYKLRENEIFDSYGKLSSESGYKYIESNSEINPASFYKGGN